VGILRDAARLVLGPLLGQVYPPAPERPLPDFDARTHAVRRLCDFIAALEFSRTGDAPGGQVVTYRVPRERCFEEQPDDPQRLDFPSVAVLPGRGVHDNWRLGPVRLIDETFGRWGRGTALADLGEYVEPVMVEAWGNHPAERRSLLAGLEGVIRLGQRSSALRLLLPAYFDRVATFQLNESQYVDDPDVVRGRRRGQVMLELRVQEVVLVDAKTLRPMVEVQHLDGAPLEPDGFRELLRKPSFPGP
jgi:hypothetical protein